MQNLKKPLSVSSKMGMRVLIVLEANGSAGGTGNVSLFEARMDSVRYGKQTSQSPL